MNFLFFVNIDSTDITQVYPADPSGYPTAESSLCTVPFTGCLPASLAASLLLGLLQPLPAGLVLLRAEGVAVPSD